MRIPYYRSTSNRSKLRRWYGCFCAALTFSRSLRLLLHGRETRGSSGGDVAVFGGAFPWWRDRQRRSRRDSSRVDGGGGLLSFLFHQHGRRSSYCRITCSLRQW